MASRPKGIHTPLSVTERELPEPFLLKKATVAARDLWGVCSLLSCPLHPAAIISASRAATAHLVGVGTAASWSLAATRHQIRGN